LFQQIAALEDIEGITISGGEPLQQWPPVLILLQQVRWDTDLSVLLFTGFTWSEIQKMPQQESLLACVDVLVAGRYDATRHLGHDLRGSANQTLHLLTTRYTEAEVQATPPAEVVITIGGEVIISGIDPSDW
jgi:anaerobic ribonucleoside-triphosphate reductase activating protein